MFYINCSLYAKDSLTFMMQKEGESKMAFADSSRLFFSISKI